MKLPAPGPGLVIRYSCLWKREAAAGRVEGTKDRPCAVILVVFDKQGRQVVRVLPITSSPPSDPADAIEIPRATATRLGLEGGRSWIVVGEANDFIWPGPDLRPTGAEGSVAYGFLPPKLFRLVRDRLVRRYRVRRLAAVGRGE